MDIVKALMDPDLDIRVTNQDKWLVYGDNNDWHVYSCKPYARNTKTVWSGPDLGTAVEKLIEKREAQRNIYFSYRNAQ